MTQDQHNDEDWIDPEMFAPFSEAELSDFAAVVCAAPEAGREKVAASHPVGERLLETVGSVEDFLRPLLAVWGEDEADAAAQAA